MDSLLIRDLMEQKLAFTEARNSVQLLTKEDCEILVMGGTQNLLHSLKTLSLLLNVEPSERWYEGKLFN